MITASLVQLSIVFGFTFIFCELGQRVSDLMKQIIDTIDQFDWYLFPMEIQRMLPILLIVAQQPIDIVVIGSTSANRDTFKKVKSLMRILVFQAMLIWKL